MLEQAVFEGHSDDWRVYEMLEQLYRIEGDLADVPALREVRAKQLPDEPGPGPAELEERLDEEGLVGYWRWKREEYEARNAGGSPSFHTVTGALHAAGGEPGRALDALRLAASEGEPALALLRSDPAWDDLRAEREFRALTQGLRVDVEGRRSEDRGGSRPSGGR